MELDYMFTTISIADCGDRCANCINGTICTECDQGYGPLGVKNCNGNIFIESVNRLEVLFRSCRGHDRDLVYRVET